LAVTDGEKIKLTFNSSSFCSKNFLNYSICLLKITVSNAIDLKRGRFQVVCARAHMPLATPLIQSDGEITFAMSLSVVSSTFGNEKSSAFASLGEQQNKAF